MDGVCALDQQSVSISAKHQTVINSMYTRVKVHGYNWKPIEHENQYGVRYNILQCERTCVMSTLNGTSCSCVRVVGHVTHEKVMMICVYCTHVYSNMYYNKYVYTSPDSDLCTVCLQTTHLTLLYR